MSELEEEIDANDFDDEIYDTKNVNQVMEDAKPLFFGMFKGWAKKIVSGVVKRYLASLKLSADYNSNSRSKH